MVIIFLLVLLYSVILHEIAHGYVAERLGDPTARLSGRLTLDPRPHIDPIGTIILPLFLMFTSGFIFGWARPVPFDPFNLKNPRRDAALISAAGPLTNFALVMAGSLLLRFIVSTNPVGLAFFIPLLVALVRINLVLGIFNLLPIAPLDGFKVMGGFLSEEKAREWYSLERYGIIFLLALILPLLPGGNSMLGALIEPVFSVILPFLIPGGAAGVI